MPELTLEQKAGKLIIGKVQGTMLDQHTKELLQKGFMGGLVIFKENAESLEQICKLIFEIQELALHKLLIMVDQEGGAIQRFDHLITPTPSAMALAAMSDLVKLDQVVSISAQQLKLMGFNCLLAPVLDVNSNPKNPVIATRSYGSEPAMVEGLGTEVAQILERNGLMATGKHFPGHGATGQDSHSLLAVNERTEEDFRQIDLEPFARALWCLPSILTGHVWLPCFDKEPLPSSLSKKVVTGILRQELNYDGLVMTDDLIMKAISNHYGVGEAAVMAIEAGNDQAMICDTADNIALVHQALVKAIDSGRIDSERLESALKRIDKVLGEYAGDYPDFSKDKIDDSRNKLAKRISELEARIAPDAMTSLEASIAGVCQLQGGLPEKLNGKWVVVVPDHPRYPLNLTTYLNEKFAKAISSGAVSFQEQRYALNPDTEEIEAIGKKWLNYNCLYVTYRTLLNKGQVPLSQVLALSCDKLITVSCDVPYDFLALDVPWYDCLASLDPSELAMAALAEILFQGVSPTGSCPVHLQSEAIV